MVYAIEKLHSNGQKDFTLCAILILPFGTKIKTTLLNQDIIIAQLAYVSLFLFLLFNNEGLLLWKMASVTNSDWGFGKLCRPPLEHGENEYSRKTLDAYVRPEPLLIGHITASYCNFSDLTSSFQFSVTKVEDKGFKKW